MAGLQKDIIVGYGYMIDNEQETNMSVRLCNTVSADSHFCCGCLVASNIPMKSDIAFFCTHYVLTKDY